jgi:ankyrin repeat protein
MAYSKVIVTGEDYMPNTRQPDNSDANKALIKAIVHEDTRAFYQALQEGASVNSYSPKNDMTALMLAAHFNMIPEVKTLIDGGADVNVKNKKGESAIEFALNRSAKTIAERDDEAEDGGQLKFRSAKLIAKSEHFDPDTILSNGRSAYMYAGMRGADSVKEVLTEKGIGLSPAEQKAFGPKTPLAQPPKLKT